MVINLDSNKRISIHQNSSIYVGEQNFDEITVLLPEMVADKDTDDLRFIMHFVSREQVCLTRVLEVQVVDEKKVGTVIVTSDFTNVAQDFYLYIEMITEDAEIIGKTNVLSVRINSLPGEKYKIMPVKEYEGTIDDLADIIQANTEAMNRIDGFEDGESAYQIAVDHGFVGTEEEWLASLKGAKGDTGAQGPKGDTGAKGDKGDTGADGKSAYEIAVEHGYSGTESEWIAMLESGAITIIDSQTSAQWGDTIPATYAGTTGVAPELAFREDSKTLWLLKSTEQYDRVYYIWVKIADTNDLNSKMGYHNDMSKRPAVVKEPTPLLGFGEVWDEGYGNNLFILTSTSHGPGNTIEYGWTPLKLTPVLLPSLPSGGTISSWGSDGALKLDYYYGDLVEVNGKVYECSLVQFGNGYPNTPFTYAYTWTEQEQPLTLSTLPIYDGSVT